MTLILACQADQIELSVDLPDDPCAQKLYVNPAYIPTPSERGLQSAYLWLKLLKKEQSDFPAHLIHSERFAEFLGRLEVDLNKISVATLEQLMSVRFLYELTQSWRKISDSQRSGALHVELMRIQPTQSRPLESPFMGRQTLETLSEANRLRLLDELESRYPLNQDVLRNTVLRETAEKLANELIFHFIQTLPNVGQFDDSPDLPLPSDRQMTALGWRGNSSFYSDLVNTSDSVAFQVEATRIDQKPINMTGQTDQIAINLDRELARRHGFVIPRFEDLQDVSVFLLNWDSTILQKLLERNRLILPSVLQNQTALATYLYRQDRLGLFRGPQSYDRLTPLRTSLSRYVMTVEDGEKFLREAFAHFLLAQGRLISRNQAPTFSYFQWKLRGEAQSLFSGDFMNWLGLRGLDVRVPIAVSRSDYSVYRLESRLRSVRSPREGR